MSDLGRQATVKKAMGTLEEDTAKEADTDEETIRGISLEPETVVDTSIFDVLAEFKLDLCLSPPTSPTPSTSTNLPPPSPSPPSSPILSRSFSFASEKAGTTAVKKPFRKPSSSGQLAATAPARSRGSWPLLKYTGRGTPIDRRRRLEWGGFSTEEVAEDGLLFATVRSSEDSTSPEWISVSSSQSQSTHEPEANNKAPSVHEPPPELGPLSIEDAEASGSDEWDSIMKSVLATTLEKPSTLIDDVGDVPKQSTPENEAPPPITSEDENSPAQPINFSIMSKEQVEELNTGLETDLGLNASLDLGLGHGGGDKWFNLKLFSPTTASRCSSPSVYSSQAVTPHRLSSLSQSPDQRSTSSTKAEGHGKPDCVVGPKFSNSWWQRVFTRLRKVQAVFTHPRSLF